MYHWDFESEVGKVRSSEVHKNEKFTITRNMFLNLREKQEKYMKIIIKDREYTICYKCGCFKSSDRCYNCDPLKMGDLDCCDQLREYYGIPAKCCSKDTPRVPDLCQTNTTHTTEKESTVVSATGKYCNPYINAKKYVFDQNKIIEHHLLEYYFTREQLGRLGLYKNVPQWQLLNVKNEIHRKTVNGMKLHEHKYKDQWQNYKNLTESQIRALIDQIPKELIETFKAE